MAIEYREWREGDDLTLLEIWGGPETEQARQFRGALTVSSAGADGAPWRRCIVAEDVIDGVGIPVAAGVVYEASLHPERLWAYIEVARDHRRAGIGATLLTMLRREAEQSPSGVSKLRAKVEPGSPGAAFAEAFGLQPIQRSRLVVVEPGALKLPVFPSKDNGGRPSNDENAGSDVVMDLATGSVELTDVVGGTTRPSTAGTHRVCCPWDRCRSCSWTTSPVPTARLCCAPSLHPPSVPVLPPARRAASAPLL